MRRLLLSELPLMMRIYPGLKPWDVDRLTVDELRGLLSHARSVLGADDGR